MNDLQSVLQAVTDFVDDMESQGFDVNREGNKIVISVGGDDDSTSEDKPNDIRESVKEAVIQLMRDWYSDPKWEPDERSKRLGAGILGAIQGAYEAGWHEGKATKQ